MKLENVNREFVNLIIDYCVTHFGYCKFDKKFPKFILYNRPCSENSHLGYYDFEKNVICIFKPDHRNCLDLVDTIVHEYTHYLQSEDKYFKLARKHKYRNHPHELEAKKIGSKHKKRAKKWAEKLLKKRLKRELVP
ncbi:hypothetical protein EBU71_02055 [bacterium]|nr:hypothetical protein [Candidatus Elulimicrobium humile]